MLATLTAELLVCEPREKPVPTVASPKIFEQTLAGKFYDANDCVFFRIPDIFLRLIFFSRSVDFRVPAHNWPIAEFAPIMRG